MAYVKTLWKDHKVPAINAVHLNNMEVGIFNATNLTVLNKQGLIDINKTVSANKVAAATAHASNASSIAQNTTAIGNNKSNQSLLTKGFHPQGNFTPQASLEYPANVTVQGFSYTIFIPNNVESYLFTTGNLKGFTIHPGDHMYYTTASPHWHILKHNYVHKATDADVKTGTNNDRYVTPKELKDNYSSYLPLAGGIMGGKISMKSTSNDTGFYFYSPLDQTEYALKVGYITNGEGEISSSKTGQKIGFSTNGDIALAPKVGMKLLYRTKEIATKSDIPSLTPYAKIIDFVPKTGGIFDGTINVLTTKHANTQIEAGLIRIQKMNSAGSTVAQGIQQVDAAGNYALTTYNAAGTAVSSIFLQQDGKVMANGKQIVTGSLSGTTLTLNL